MSLLRVWCSDDNAVLRQKLRPGIADRIAPLLADIIGQGVQDGVFTVAYPDQMGRVIVALIQDLNDRLAELDLTAESGPRTLRTGGSVRGRVRKPTGGFWRLAQQQGSDLFDRFLEP